MIKNGGPSDVNVELLSSDGSEDPIASVLTSSDGSYLFKNIIPGKEYGFIISVSFSIYLSFCYPGLAFM